MKRFINKGFQSRSKLREALSEIYGVSVKKRERVCRSVGLRPWVRLSERTDEQWGKVVTWIRENLVAGPELKRAERESLLKIMSRGRVRGVRLRKGYPVNGGRTRTNGKTAQKRNRRRVRNRR